MSFGNCGECGGQISGVACQLSSVVFAALTQRLQMSVADARSDLQRHGSSLRSAASRSDSRDARRQPHLRPISPDRTIAASISASIASPRRGAAVVTATPSSPRILSVQRTSVGAHSSASSSHVARGLRSGPKQDGVGIESQKKRFPSGAPPAGTLWQSPKQLQSAGAVWHSPTQKRFTVVSDTDPSR